MRLQNKVAIITGGANGQGASEATLFASEGAKVIVADIREDLGRKLVSDIESMGGIAEFVYLDVRNDKQWEELVKHVLGKFAKIDVLVNNAAISGSQPDLLSASEYDKIMEVNAKLIPKTKVLKTFVDGEMVYNLNN